MEQIPTVAMTPRRPVPPIKHTGPFFLAPLEPPPKVSDWNVAAAAVLMLVLAIACAAGLARRHATEQAARPASISVPYSPMPALVFPQPFTPDPEVIDFLSKPNGYNQPDPQWLVRLAIDPARPAARPDNTILVSTIEPVVHPQENGTFTVTFGK
jgi:hypothetical protein